MNSNIINRFIQNKHHCLLTKDGLDNLKAKLDHLNSERHRIYDHIRKVDPKDKFDYLTSTDEIRALQRNEAEVEKIVKILRYAQVIDKKDSNYVELGSTVDLKLGNNVVKYTLVDSIEANPLLNKISPESPLGRALIGKKLHEIVRFANRKGRKYNYEVLDIV